MSQAESSSADDLAGTHWPKKSSTVLVKRHASLLSRLLRIRPVEWLLLVKMSVMLGSLLILQRFLALPKLMGIYDTKPQSTSWLEVSPQRLVYLVTGLVRATLKDRYCMKRSILIFHFLRKWGYNARIYFGVVKQEDKLEGHAWVDLDGYPVAERGDPRRRYTVTYSYPPEQIEHSS